jgi:protocatechuate 3,4-dioxygenase beta subunit
MDKQWKQRIDLSTLLGRRLPRRETLKGLGALAVTGGAFAAACGSDDPPLAATDGVGQTGAAGAGATPPPATSASAGQAGASTGGAAGATRSVPSGVAGAAPGAASAAGAAAPAAAGAAAPTTATAGAPSMSAGAGAAGAGAAPMATDISMLQCIATPAMDEGPFFVEQELNRQNLIEGETSVQVAKALPLHLVMGIHKVSGTMCMPAPGVQVDIWHANAFGEYSDVASGFIQSVDTRGKTWLRGFQITDEAGLVSFDTIYPGWYMSRAIHIHFKVRMPGGSGTYDFTSQMYFDEELNSKVLAMEPYASHEGTRTVLNEDDHIFNGTAMNGQQPPGGMPAPGKSIMPVMVERGAGYEGTLKIGLMI